MLNGSGESDPFNRLITTLGLSAPDLLRSIGIIADGFPLPASPEQRALGLHIRPLDETLRDRDILELATKVECVEDPEATFPKYFSGGVEIYTKDGRKLRRYKRRWKVERLNAWLQNFRRLIVRHEVQPALFQGLVHAACMVIVLRRL